MTALPSKKPTPEELFSAWQADPTPDNLNRVVRSMDDVIGYRLSAMNINDNAQMKHQARLFAADAVRKYDPASGANLRTWTQSQLQSMQRFKRENQMPVKIADRAAVDAWAIERASRELEDQYGFEPDVKQLADRSGLSVKRIATVRKATRPVASSGQMQDGAGNELPDFLGEALEYVYDESDRVDRKIIEYTTGYGGAPLMNKKDVAAKLGISASQVTRRSERIGQKIATMDQDIESTHA